MKESLIENFKEQLCKQYPDILFVITNKRLVGEIIVIAALFNTEAELENEWEALSSSVCTLYQMRIKNEFSKWNTYVFYVCKDSVSKELKYQIENDKFSNRKIVVSDNPDSFNSDYVDKLVSSKITLDSLPIEKYYESATKDFKINSLIGEIIKSQKINSKGELESFEDALKTIETKLKDENIQS